MRARIINGCKYSDYYYFPKSDTFWLLKNNSSKSLDAKYQSIHCDWFDTEDADLNDSNFISLYSTKKLKHLDIAKFKFIDDTDNTWEGDWIVFDRSAGNIEGKRFAWFFNNKKYALDFLQQFDSQKIYFKHSKPIKVERIENES